MRRLGPIFLAASLLVGCGPSESEPSPESPAQQGAPLTTTDVDVAPECQGLLTFVNTASFATLDAYLPVDVVHNLVGRRQVSPILTLAELSAVHLVGPERLTQLETGARYEGYITSTCAGVLDELALSADDAAAVVTLVNTVSPSVLYAVLHHAWNGATNLINLRPFPTVHTISNVSGIGAVSLRNLRNAATMGYSFSVLSAAVNALPENDFTVRMDLDFTVEQILAGQHGNGQYVTGTCFGINPSTFPYPHWTNRPTLATATEVHDQVTSAITFANRHNAIPGDVVTDGFADLDARIAGGTFKGCQLSYRNGPWAGIQVTFYVDTVTGFRVLTEWHWTE